VFARNIPRKEEKDRILPHRGGSDSLSLQGGGGGKSLPPPIPKKRKREKNLLAKGKRFFQQQERKKFPSKGERNIKHLTLGKKAHR